MDDATHCWNEGIGIALAGLLVMAGLSGCEERQPGVDAKKETPAATTQPEPSAGEAKQEMPAAAADIALMAPASSPGGAANNEGVSHAQQSHWDVAEAHFLKALEADPKLAEAQFNLGLALDKLGKHDEAKSAFMKAAELAPGNTKITESPILKRHTST
jgi:Flp pilus assembly protein TadD